MQCPIDGTQLMITERSGVEIDYCPKCRGVWLDRGELDKIIERSSAHTQPQRPVTGGYTPQYKGHKPKKKKSMGSFLEDIFDF